MARPVTRFTDDEMRGILAAAVDANDSAPVRTDDFLDRFIAGVEQSTGRLFGRPIYERLLGTAGVARRPSAQTWVKAIGRARKRPTLTTGASADVPVEWKSRAQIAEATSRDAYARLAVLETERAELIGRTAAAERAAQLIAEQIQQAQRDHKDETAALLACIDALTGSVDRLTGMERHLRLQTDLLRQELGQQAEFYKGRAEAAEKALAIERSQTDALRRLLGNRAPPVVSGTR